MQTLFFMAHARGDANEYSDYDILIIVDGFVDMALEKRILDKIYPLEVETCQVLTFIVYSKQDWDSPLYKVMPLHKNVDRDGVIL
jgi:predicted nucleotidyltransferase